MDKLRGDSASVEKQPSRLPMLSELGIVLCVGAWPSIFAWLLGRIVGAGVSWVSCTFHAGAVAAFRMADSKGVSGSAAAAQLLVTLTAALASFRKANDGTTLRMQLHARHKDGVAVGALCIPIVSSAVLLGDPGNNDFAEAFWISVLCSLLITLRLLTPRLSTGSRKSADALMATTFGWAAILSLTLGAFTLGVFHTAAVVIAFDVLCALLRPILLLSVGEQCVIGEALVILGNAAVTLAHRAWTAPLVTPVQDDEFIVNMILIVLLFGTGLAALALWPVFAVYGQRNFDVGAVHSGTLSPPRASPSTLQSFGLIHKNDREDAPPPRMGTAVVLYVYAVLFSAMALLETPWLTALIGQNPFVWVGGFMWNRPSRMAWTAYWVVMLLAVTNFAPTAGSTAIPNIVVRKFFHFVAVAMFAPVIMEDLQLMRLAFVIATMAILFAEFMRVVRLPNAGLAIHKFMGKYIDARDAGYVTATHLYLIVGCAVSIWLPFQSSSTLGNAVLYCGVLILGVACAGTYFGRSKWPGTRKSLEGTAAGFIAVILCICTLQLAAVHTGLSGHIIHVSTFEIIQYCAAVACACFLETFTKQVDNLILPLYFFGSLVLLSPRA